MRFEWDEIKNLKNTEKHKISFQEGIQIFTSRIFTVIDNRFDYGEIGY